jgi:putative glutamine amidotransferase
MTTDPASTAGAAAVPRRRLRIGLSANYLAPDADRRFYPHSWLLYAEQHMVTMLAGTGALVYLIPPPVVASTADTAASVVAATSMATPADVAADLDALVLAGGADVAPSTYGAEPLQPQWAGQPERDHYEISLLRAFIDAGRPVLGICRGHQLLNVALGGTLYQDLATELDTQLEHRSQERYHRNLHDVAIEPGSGLAALYPDQPTGTVISVHHQAICDLAPGLSVEARCTTDDIIEAVRLDRSAVGAPQWAVGVQWHPEFEGIGPPATPLLAAAPLLDEFMAAAAARVTDRTRGGQP